MAAPNHRPPPADVSGDSKLTDLSRSESWELVTRSSLGRLAFVIDGWPLVLPVNYLVDGDDVVIRSDPGQELRAARQQVQVALQVDSIDPLYRSGWSVLVFGKVTVIDDPKEAARLDRLGLHSWAASDRSSWIRLQPVDVTGRRLPRAWRYPGPI